MKRESRTFFAPKMLTLALASAAAMPAMADPSDFHAYIRTGIGQSADGGDQVCYKAEGAPAKYRLGNECETYAALRLIKPMEVEGGAKFKVTTEVIYESDQNTDWEQVNGNTESPDRIIIRRFNVAGTDVIESLPGATLWIGKEFVDRQNVHINDFFYWDPKGPGVGIRNIDLGFGKLSAAWLRGGSNDFDSDSSGSNDANAIYNTYDVRLTDVKLTDTLTMEAGIDLGATSVSDDKDYADDNDGLLLTVNFITKDFLGGSNKLILQHASDGMISSGNTGNHNGALSGDFVRVIDTGTIPMGSSTEAQFVVIYEDKNVDDNLTNTGHEWLSAGIRPVVSWSQYSSTAVELGYDSVKNKLSGDTASLTKLTVAQQFAAGSRFFSRPSLRLFATYAMWDDAGVNDNSAGFTPANATDGLSFGAQTEVWF